MTEITIDLSFVIRLGGYALLVVGTTMAAGIWPARGDARPGLLQAAMAIAAGVMLGAVFFHMLPEAVSEVGPRASWAVALGFALIFLLERFVLVHACDVGPCHQPADTHGHCCADPSAHEQGLAENPVVPLVAPVTGSPKPTVLATGTLGLTAFIGLSIHTAFDGVALGSAMLTGGMGAVVLLAIVLHNIPLSFSLSSVLRHEGRGTARVLVMVSIFAFMVPIGAGLFVLLASYLEAERALGLTPWALAFSAGTFLHIAFSDLLPELHRQRAKALPAVTLMFAGLGLMLLLTHFASHGH